MLKNNKHTCDDCIHNQVCEWAVNTKTLFSCDDYISTFEVTTDQDIIKHMDAIKAYCKKCTGCINCPMYDNCAADNIRRFPRYWYIPEVR